MEKLDKLEMEEFTNLNVDSKNLLEIFKIAISKANKVYVFRSHEHLKDETELISWIKLVSINAFKKIEILFKKEKHIEIIKAVGKNEKVHLLNLNEETRLKFAELFKISIKDVKSSLNELEICYENELFIDDPLYDQYDFIFTSDNKVVLLTSIHDFNFIVAKDIMKQK